MRESHILCYRAGDRPTEEGHIARQHYTQDRALESTDVHF